jgi:type I restriction enzyme S subunit
MSDFVEITSSKRVKRADYVAKGIPFYRSKEVIERAKGNRITTELFISDEQYTEIEKKFGTPQFGDILLTSVGTLGVSWQVEGDESFYFKDGNLTWFRNFSQRLDPTFLLYWLRSRTGQQELDRISIGSTQRALTIAGLKSLPFSPPKLSDQKAIAHILGTLDDKIELNQKMNHTLEEIAKAIFKSWFVDFDPVRAKAEGRPTGLPPEISDLFPDELVDSEIGEIPKGWDVGALSDVADITMGQSPPGDTYNDDGVGLPFYQGSTDFGFRFPSLRKYCSEPKRLADADDVLISVRAPVGDLNRAKDDCCIGRGLASLRAKNSLQTWVFYRCKFLSQQLETFNSEGTVFGSINGKDLKGLPTILAPELLCKAFDEIAKPMDDAVRNRTLEIEVLSELRDTLLPKLISGELRIPDAKKFLEEAGI